MGQPGYQIFPNNDNVNSCTKEISAGVTDIEFPMKNKKQSLRFC